MTRRRVVVLASALTIFAIVGLLALAALMITRTAWGRDQVRVYVEDLLNSRVKGGKWHLGRVTGSLFTDLQIDSFAIRDANDSLFVSTGKMTVRFDPRDIWDRRLLVRQLWIEHPVVHISQDSSGKWNYRNIFPSGPPGPKGATRGFGDYIVVENAELREGAFHLTMPWRPADSLRGARRDSAVAFALGRTDKRIRRSGSQFSQTRSWTRSHLQLSRGRISDPDSVGRFFQVERLDADEFDPPMKIANARGTVRTLGDSVWMDFEHFELPGSRGSAGGKVWWGSNLPTRYDVRVRGDSVSLKDVAWVYPTLPTTGGGKMDLRIRNERDLRVLDYELTNMDVRTVGSRLRGAMTFGVGGPVLIVKDVAVEATPIDWELIEDFTGKPLPYPWKGKITTTVKASGGPVNAFRIDEASFSFADANVLGATASGRGSGELDILFPAFTRFKAFDVEVNHLDLSTLQFINPVFPRLDGSIHGRVTLDSVWTDVRFRNADLTHRFGNLPSSRMTGSGRVTIGEKLLTYDVAMEAVALELNTIALAWPELVLEQRGTFSGPLRLQGTAEDLAVATELTGTPGTYAFDGRVDIDSVGGYGYHGTLRFKEANLRTLYDTASLPNTALNGVAELDLVGDSLLNYVGTVGLDLERSLVDSTRLYDGARARLSFLNGRLRVDTISLESAAGRLDGAGGLGLVASQSDSLRVRFTSDSLGWLRPYLLRSAVDSTARAIVEVDSLKGMITGQVTLAGSIDTLTVRGVADAREVDAYALTTRHARVTADLVDATSERIHGKATVTADTLVGATVVVRNAAVDVAVQRGDSSDVRLMAELANGPTVGITAHIGVAADTVRVAMSEASFGFGDHAWTLAHRGGVRWWTDAFAVDSVLLKGSRGGLVALRGVASAQQPVALTLALDSVALEDISALGQLKAKLAGTLSMSVDVTGTREQPLMDLRGQLTGTKVGQVNISETTLRGTYAAQRFNGSLGVMRGDTAVLQVLANVPLDLALVTRSRRLLDDTMRVSLVSRDVDLKLVESFTPAVTGAAGRLNADVSYTGRSGTAAIEGFVRVDSASAFVVDLGVQLRDFVADVRAAHDTVRIVRFTVVSGDATRNNLSLDGFVALDRGEDPGFSLNLKAQEFHVVNKRRIGDLTMSAGLRFAGRESASVLTGDLTVNSGSIVIPELTSKQIVNVDDPTFTAIADTALGGSRAVLPRLPRLLQGLTAQNVQIMMGSDVTLRSSEASIKLGGSVNVIRASGLSAAGVPQLTVEGALRTERGTFLMRFGDGLLQRLFSIEGGEVRFFGDADFNPTLNIRALYSVRQANQLYSNRNIRIRVRLLGTLAQPRISLESADSLQVSDSDLISYLFTGRPSADIGGLDPYYAADLLLTNLSSSLSARYSGRFFDYLQLQAVSGGLGPSSTSRNQGLFAGLLNTQLGLGKQLNNRTFLSLTTGLCSLQQFTGSANATSTVRASELIGGTLEYTIRPGLGVSVSREPVLAALLCGRDVVGFAASRGAQLSFDLFKTWRW